MNVCEALLPAGNVSVAGITGNVPPEVMGTEPPIVSAPLAVTGTVHVLLLPPVRVTTTCTEELPTEAADEVVAKANVTGASGSTTGKDFELGLPMVAPPVGVCSATVHVPELAPVSTMIEYVESPSAKAAGVVVALLHAPVTVKATVTAPRVPARLMRTCEEVEEEFVESDVGAVSVKTPGDEVLRQTTDTFPLGSTVIC